MSFHINDRQRAVDRSIITTPKQARIELLLQVDKELLDLETLIREKKSSMSGMLERFDAFCASNGERAGEGKRALLAARRNNLVTLSAYSTDIVNIP
jgi:hypothetical protein